MPYLVLIAALLFAAAPLFSPGFGGYTPDQYPIPQVSPPALPATYAFSIWGLIYLWLVISAGFGAFKRRDAADWAPMRPPLLLSLAVGVPWLTVATMSPVWATVMIWIMWAGAALALWQAPARDMWLASFPTGLYAGWLTAASSVSTALLLGGYGLLSPANAALAGLALALVLSLAIMGTRARPYGFAVAVVWALIALMIGNWSDGSTLVAWASAGGAVIVATSALLQLRKPV
ncbi:hypothetical protein K1T73_15325 [Roseovarius sp. SCSIO 43702]|uniref:hypothetical protein n=1 Tax=Roseovarius sp. SCSIO 43702 TaxID=2823043 RepID=UPI001C7331D6|nr:hypothetical protein [Roseovarius sp. SCSIO 43702]QYX56407.1 hypothetical protein K1T73_15325 [Roseovarius sp. SCSIO 43702]